MNQARSDYRAFALAKNTEFIIATAWRGNRGGRGMFPESNQGVEWSARRRDPWCGYSMKRVVAGPAFGYDKEGRGGAIAGTAVLIGSEARSAARSRSPGPFNTRPMWHPGSDPMRLLVQALLVSAVSAGAGWASEATRPAGFTERQAGPSGARLRQSPGGVTQIYGPRLSIGRTSGQSSRSCLDAQGRALGLPAAQRKPARAIGRR